jgi:hypothetical protein
MGRSASELQTLDVLRYSLGDDFGWSAPKCVMAMFVPLFEKDIPVHRVVYDRRRCNPVRY